MAEYLRDGMTVKGVSIEGATAINPVTLSCTLPPLGIFTTEKNGLLAELGDLQRLKVERTHEHYRQRLCWEAEMWKSMTVEDEVPARSVQGGRGCLMEQLCRA